MVGLADYAEVQLMPRTLEVRIERSRGEIVIVEEGAVWRASSMGILSGIIESLFPGSRVSIAAQENTRTSGHDAARGSEGR